MGGLLYQNFVAVRGKKMLIIFTVSIVAFIVLRMLFPGNPELDASQPLDLLSFSFEFFILFFVGSIINIFEPRLLEFDEKNHVRSYLFSTPLSRKKYVASKYVFVGIIVYIEISLYMLCHTVSVAFMVENGFAYNLSQTFAGFVITFVSVQIIAMALEMPLYFMFGREKAMMIRVSFWMIISFIIIGYLFFGDLRLISNWNLDNLRNWMNTHSFELTVLSVISPVISVGLYYLSYRITARLYERRGCL